MQEITFKADTQSRMLKIKHQSNFGGEKLQNTSSIAPEIKEIQAVW